MITILRRLGVYRALNASAVQFNSIIFRVVVGFLAGIPGEIIALIPTIEFLINFFLEIPTGYLADKYGRIPFAIAGHLTVILGLFCGYIGLLEPFGPQAAYIFFVFHGIFIGFTRPLTSGSVEAFYHDALKRTSSDAASEAIVSKSLTLSKAYGKHLTTIAVTAAFVSLFIFHHTIGAHHAFILGIGLWAAALWKLIDDYKALGDVRRTPNNLMPILKILLRKKRALNSVVYTLSGFMLLGIVMGYFIVSLGREIPAETSHFKWLTIFAFMMGSQGLGWVTKSYILPLLINKISEKKYLTFFYSALLTSSLALLYSFSLMPEWAVILLVFFYGLIFFTAFSAIQSVAQNMVLGQVGNNDFALVLSVQNMPGLLFVGLYSLYLTIFRNGCPSINEILISVASICFVFLFYHLCMHADYVKHPAIGVTNAT